SPCSARGCARTGRGTAARRSTCNFITCWSVDVPLGRTMSDVTLAILWHQHQPYYPDDVGGDNAMPWVRLHGVKDYYGMALHLLEVPEMRCTITLVPSLIFQLQAYTDRGAADRPMLATRLPAS